MLPPGIILPYHSTHASIPTDWTRDTRFDGRYIKTATASLGTTGGSSTHTHTSSSHTHTYTNNGHVHETGTIGGWLPTVKSDARHKDAPPYEVMTAEHTHYGKTTDGMSSTSITSATPSIGNASNEVNRIHYIFITTNKYKPYPANAIILRDDTATRINATHLTDATGRYMKGAGTGADAGTPTDTATHSHTQSHTHTLSHNHAIQGEAYSATGKLGGGEVDSVVSRDHGHLVYATAHSENVTNSTPLSTHTNDLSYRELHHWKSDAIQVPRVGDIALVTGAIPIGWVDAGFNTGVYIKGKASGQSLTTGGSLTHTHSNINHSHAGSSHTHPWNTNTVNYNGAYRNGGSTNVTGTHVHYGTTTAATNASTGSTSISFTTVNHEPPYILARFVKMQYSPIKQAPLMLLL